VLAEKILLELGSHIGGRNLIDENQEAKLAAILSEIVNDQSQLKRIKR
jgi:hypothetical protein